MDCHLAITENSFPTFTFPATAPTFSLKKFFIFSRRFLLLYISKSSHEKHSSDRKHNADKKEGKEHILETKYNMGYYMICIGEVTISALKQGWIKVATLQIHQT